MQSRNHDDKRLLNPVSLPLLTLAAAGLLALLFIALSITPPPTFRG